MNYCRYCGTKLRQGAKFCKKCGHNLQTASTFSAETESRDDPYSPPAPAPKITKAKKKRRFPKLIAAVALLLALVIGGQYIIYRFHDTFFPVVHDLEEEEKEYDFEAEAVRDVPYEELQFGHGEGTDHYQEVDQTGVVTSLKYSDGEINNADTKTAEISQLKPSATLGNVTVEFGAFNIISDTETLTVRSLPKKTDTDNGFQLIAWDFSLKEQSEFDGLAEITVSYMDLGVEDPLNSIIAQRYNEKLNRWEHIAYEIDEEAQTVTMYTEHFSIEGIFMYIPLKIMEHLDEREKAKRELEKSFLPMLLESESRNLLMNIGSNAFSKACSDMSILRWAIENKEMLNSTIENNMDSFIANESLLGKVSRNLGLINSGSGFVVSLLDFIKNATSKIGVFFAWTSVIFTEWDFFQKMMKVKSWKQWLEAWKEFAPEFVVGAFALAAAVGAIASTPLTGAMLLLAGAVLLIKSLYTFDYDGARKSAYEKVFDNLPELDSAYYTQVTENLFWSQSENKVVWANTKRYNDIIRDDRAYKDYKNNTYYDYLSDGENLALEKFDKAYDKYKNADKNKDLVQLGSPENGRGWLYIMRKIMDKYPKNPERWINKFQEELKKVAKLAYDENVLRLYRKLYNGDRIAEQYTEEDKPEFDDEDMADHLILKLQENMFYRIFIKKMMAEAEKITNKKFSLFRNNLNKKLEVKLVDKNGRETKFSDTQFRDKFIVFDTEPELYNMVQAGTGKEDKWRVKMDSPTLTTFTYSSWIMAGRPTKLLVYESKSDFDKGKEPDDWIYMTEPQMGKKNAFVKLYSDEAVWQLERMYYEDYYHSEPGLFSSIESTVTKSATADKLTVHEKSTAGRDSLGHYHEAANETRTYDLPGAIASTKQIKDFIEKNKNNNEWWLINPVKTENNLNEKIPEPVTDGTRRLFVKINNLVLFQYREVPRDRAGANSWKWLKKSPASAFYIMKYKTKEEYMKVLEFDDLKTGG